jgi:deoxyhypusine synthase
MIRQDKVHIISCTGANLEEDIMNLVAHSHTKECQITEIYRLKKNGIY